MSQITLRQLSFRFRGPALFDEIHCEIQAGQRIGLLGRNGSGKTTLMKVLAGEVVPDSGQVILAPGLRLARLVQDVPDGHDASVFQMVRAAFSPTGSESLGGDRESLGVGGKGVGGQTAGRVAADRVAGEGAGQEDVPDWEVEQRVDQILSRMQLDGEARFGSLSSGMKRRVLLARALVQDPDVLLLDEPTNHLDVEAIQWLEGFLTRWSGTLIFVTHDRAFLQKLATRILELDRGQLFDWQCDYETFLQRKEAALEAEEKQNALFDKRLAEEEAWIRQGIKARRTRNMGRVRALVEMRRLRQERRDKVGKVDLQIDAGLRSGQMVVSLKDVSFAYGEKSVFEHFSTTIMRGDKVGIIGPNGAGKSTLLRVLLGKLPASRGQVRLGTNLQVAYFDQLREQLDPEQTVQDNVGDGYENITINGRSRHIIGYLSDFLFSAERARTAIKHLSGGERNRVLLAKLFAKAANVIVLDEPTNDLDLETLEILEARLVEYPGTVLMVSHDRTFLDNVVTSTIAFESSGVFEYDGGYADWQRQMSQKNAAATKSQPRDKKVAAAAPVREKASTAATMTPAGTDKSAAPPAGPPTAGRRLKYAERLELERLPQQIQDMEAQIQQRQQQMEAAEFFQRSHAEVTRFTADLAALQAKAEAMYARWDELERMAKA